MNHSPNPSAHSPGWRASILAHFTPEIAEATRLTIVHDPDHLFAEQMILGELHERGFDLVLFDDHIAFRFIYESRYRQIWDRGEKTNLVVVLRSPSEGLDALPYDLLEQARRQGRCLSLSVGKLFPKLAPNVVLGLDRSCFEALFVAQAQEGSARLGIDASCDFVLRHVFGIAPELIKTPAGLLHVLLRRHYRVMSFPPYLDERFIHLLNQDSMWKGWPLAQIVPDRAAFLEFLDERWPFFVRRSTSMGGGQAKKTGADYNFRFSGPVELPFGHDDLKTYIDNLFQEGLLNPVVDYTINQVPEPWMRVGMACGDGDGRFIRFGRLLARLKTEIPTETSQHREWIDFAQTWAEWSAIRWQLIDSGAVSANEDYEQLHDHIEQRFAVWMLRSYAALHNLSTYHRPAMVHHIPRHMAHGFMATSTQGAGSNSPAKFALIVMDGLSLDLWVVLRDIVLSQIDGDIKMSQDGSFAWVPTLTGVSRQAIFASAEPLFFAGNLGSTSKEKTQWTRFWEKHGAKQMEIGYVREGKDQTDNDFLSAVFKVAEHPKMRLLGIVVSKIDQSMHGIKTGSGGLHAIVGQWARSGAMGRLFSGLIELGYDLTITADHGNIHYRGIGRPNVGVVPEERGERVHVFNDENTRAAIAKDFPDAISWPQIGLPETYRALLAPNRGAFLAKDQNAVGHGGIAMEEVIVPFVKISGGTK